MTKNNNCCIKVYSANVSGGLKLSVPDTKQIISATNNRAEYFAEQAKAFRDEAKEHRDNAKYYAEQNSDVTFNYIDGIYNDLQSQINSKQNLGNYALKEDIPINVSELNNDAEYINKISFDKFANKELETIDEINQALDTKLDINGTNLNPEGKSLFTSLAFPGKFENLTLGASDSTYTAPANGWVHYLAEATGAGSSINITSCGINEFSTASTVGSYHSVTVPVLKGSSFYVGYNKATKIVFRFIYAEGDV